MTPRGTAWPARGPLALGFAAIAFLVGGLGAWSVGTEIAGAVVAPGTVRVESDRQVIQHPDGGVVGEIRARDGDRVSAGDVLVRLDGTFLRNELGIVEKQLLEIAARKARLRAERDGRAAPDFGSMPPFETIGPALAADQMAGQRRLFAARRASLAQERRQLARQQSRIERRIDGIETQRAALTRQLELVGQELANVRSLRARGLVPVARLLDLRREQARLEGDIGRLTAAAAEARTRISGIGIEILKLSDRRREEAITRLRDLQSAENELAERRLGLLARLDRLDVRAPVGGVVFGSRIMAVQAVVRPAEPMMYLVPGAQPLEVAARVRPVDVDEVYPGQEVALKFTAFGARTIPDIPGRVLRVSADAARAEDSGEPYYEAVLRPEPAALAALPEITLRPGMPAEAFIRTRERTPLSYLTRPLTAYFQRAFREG